MTSGLTVREYGELEVADIVPGTEVSTLQWVWVGACVCACVCVYVRHQEIISLDQCGSMCYV